VGDEARVLDAHPRYRGRGVVGRAPHASPPEDRSAREDYEQDEADRRPSPPADRRWGGPGRARPSRSRRPDGRGLAVRCRLVAVSTQPLYRRDHVECTDHGIYALTIDAQAGAERGAYVVDIDVRE